MTSNTQPNILVAGDTTADFYPVEPPAVSEGSSLRWFMGGTGANVARSLAIFGRPPYFATKLSNDVFGQAIRTHLTQLDIPPGLLTTSEKNTPFIAYTPTQDRQWDAWIANSCFGFALPDDSKSVFEDISMLHLSGTSMHPAVSQDAVLEAIDCAKKHDVAISFDLNGRPSQWPNPDEYAQLVENIAANCSLIFASHDDLELAGYDPTYDGIKELVSPDGTTMVFCTFSEDGSIAAQFEDGVLISKHKHAGYDVEVADPAGAGDAFDAAILRAYVDGVRDLADLSQLGNAAGAAAVTSVGPFRRPDRSTFEELS